MEEIMKNTKFSQSTPALSVARRMSVHEAPNLEDSRHYSNWIIDYEVKETIGEGCFGKVKLGINKTTGEKVALKLIDHKMLNNAKLAEKFKREILILKVLNHPNIVKMIEVIESPENEFTCLVFEHVAGGDLLEFVMNQKEGRLDEFRTAKIFSQIVNAVKYLHENGITHRDLKLENVMLDQEGNVAKLIDFGLANHFDETTLLKTPCGSPTYTAPEILYREPYQGNKVDVWSLGVMLYSMLAGNVPWEGNNDAERIANVKVGRWLPDKFLSEEVQGLLDRCFTMDADFRADISDIANHPWLAEAQKIKGEGAGRTIQKMFRRLSLGFFPTPARETARSE